MSNNSKWIKLAGLTFIVLFALATVGNFSVAQAADDPAQRKVRPVLVLMRDLTTATTKLTSLTVKDIRKGLADGKSLSELITAAGGKVDQVKSAAKEAALKQIDEALSKNKITKEQAEKLRGKVDTALDTMLNHKGKVRQKPSTTSNPTAPATQGS